VVYTMMRSWRMGRAVLAKRFHTLIVGMRLMPISA